MSPVPMVRVVRSGLEESVHLGEAAVVDADATVVARVGDPSVVAFARSSMKPLQAAVSLSHSSISYPDAEIAVMCASHNAEPIHVEAVRSILERSGVDAAALRCPAALPWDQPSALADPVPRPINSDCSGKHAGMLGACLERGWPLTSYRAADHPLQLEVLNGVVAATGSSDLRVGVDGCGVPVHGVTVRAMATIYARLARPERLGPLEAYARRAVAAMASQPYMVAGRNRVDTAVMQAVDGVVVKAGAEGMICAAILDAGLGVAVKIHDGGARGAGPALIHLLSLLGALDESALSGLGAFAAPDVLGGREPVGRIEPVFELDRA